MLGAATVLYENGQSTNMTLVAADRLGRGLNQPVAIIPTWASLTAYDPRPGGQIAVVATRPNAVNMRRVVAVMNAVDAAEDGPLEQAEMEQALADARRLPPSSTVAFVTACAVGAAALAVVFGSTDPRAVALVAAAAGIGAVLRRLLAKMPVGPLVETFVAAVVAGVAGAVALHADLGAAATLVAVCPAMVLVPGPQVLIGAMDLLGLRISLALARIGYALVIMAAIAAGLVVGLRLGGQSLPLSSSAPDVPFVVDVLAAGIAAACYPVFFSMPYRLLMWPVVAGMASHALHWWSTNVWQLSLPYAALLSCLLVGSVLTPLAYRLRIPFAAVGFAAVVALVPGMYFFRAVAGVIQLAGAPSAQLLLETTANSVTAVLTVVCMAVGLAIPTRVRDWLVSRNIQP